MCEGPLQKDRNLPENLCSSFLGSILYCLIRKQVITKKEQKTFAGSFGVAHAKKP